MWDRHNNCYVLKRISLEVMLKKTVCRNVKIGDTEEKVKSVHAIPCDTGRLQVALMIC